MSKDGYNSEKFKVTCFRCGSDESSIIEHELNDIEDEVIGLSWYIKCDNCGNCDI